MRKIYPLNTRMRVMSAVISLAFLAGAAPWAGNAVAADTIQTLVTSYQPVINETIDASGFKHPGVGLTKDILENMRTQVLAQKEPWNSHFNAMLRSSAASKTISSNNQGSDPTKPSIYAFNSQGVESRFIADSLKAYTQAVLYYVTGDETYRANAMRLIRIWAQMDPNQYAYYNDAHIHSGIPLNRMVTAAEILRYSSCQTAALQWTDQDTTMLTTNLITPVIEVLQHKNTYFMNQHLYPLLGAMAGYIFTGNKARYEEGVEWFTVNRTAIDQGQNGAIKQLFRLVDKNDATGEAVDPPVVQHVEMGRDQAHGAGDVTNVEILARLLLGQGTKVDPVEGTLSTAPNAVGPYEFLNDRILDAAEFFGKYMMGNDVPWVPTASHTDASGNPTVIYRQLSGGYRGRLTQNTWELYYYYKYVRGIDMETRAPYFTRMFADRTSYNWDGVDGGGDFWLFMPAAAAAEGSKYLVKPIADPYREVEDRFSALDENTTAKQDGTAAYLEVTATAAGSRVAIVGYSNGARTIGFRVRTNGIATMEAFGDTITLPDTKGEWKNITYTFNVYQGWGDLEYLTIKGSGTTVQIDSINVQASTQLSAPVFTAGPANQSIYTYAGSSSTIAASFAATDSVATDVVSYQIDNMPQGASFDTGTGAFSWKPTQAGTYTFVVSASDGNTMTSKRVTVVVATDRAGALAAAASAYDAGTLYVASTLAAYNAAYADATNALSAASDDEFNQKLATLNSTVTGLKKLTPLMGDGSIDYSAMLVSSTFGTSIPQALDNNPDSFVGYFLAQNLAHTLDFGPSFKISANAFQLQVRSGFPERIGGVAIFGSDDKENWTRLTPGLTVVDDQMQTLPVSDDLKNAQYRFLKIAMIQPSTPLLELSEFRIFGARHETVNKLASVSLSSDQALKGRIIPGNTVKLAFQSTEAINNVSVLIQGKPATLTTTDNLNWVASWVVEGTAPPGAVKFVLSYKTAAGVEAAPTIFTTDNTALVISDQTNFMSNLPSIATLKDSSGRTPTELVSLMNSLLDSNLASVADIRVNGSGSGAWLMFDFKGGGTATLSRVEVIGRQDQYASRINGTVVQGSNDSSAWTTISNAAGNTSDWQTLTINNTLPFRYIRIYNGNQWFGNMSELRLYGTSQSTNQIATVSMTSDQQLINRIVPGNTVKLSFTAKEVINNVSATIQGQAATVTTSDNITFTATATLPQGVQAGAVTFAINYRLQNGQDGYANTATTDSTGLTLVDEADVIKNLPGITTLIDSTYNRSAATTLSQVNALLDGNINSFSDFRIGTSNSGTGSYITFDFKAGNQATLTSVELLARQDQTARIKGTVVQGSNDNTNWTSLTAPGAASGNWQTMPVGSGVPYRYLRIYNGNNWVGNMAEVRFHGLVKGADVTAPVTTSNAPQGWANRGTVVTFTPTDDSSGVAATYYTVDGGAQQTGTAVTLPTSGTHTLSYWSVDKASNTEQAHTVSVNIGPQNISSSVQMTQQGATLNRVTGKYVGSVTVTNTSGAALAGPLQLSLSALADGITLDNASGTDSGAPYVTLAGGLAGGATVNVPLTFTNPNRSVVGYTPVFYQGSF